jgi:ABC-2 type transport system ATP-binding protein
MERLRGTILTVDELAGATDAQETDGEHGCPLVSAIGLCKRFSDKNALHAVNFELHAGEVIALLGPNGAGKTTTLKLLLGLLKPSAGHASILGFDCTRHSQRVKGWIGFTPDEPQFYDFLTGMETLDFVIDVRGLDARAAWGDSKRPSTCSISGRNSAR